MKRVLSMSQPVTSQRLGQKLRTLRKRHGFTLQELADQLATTNGYLSMLETGQREPRAAFVFRLARFFNVSTDVLLDDDIDLEAPHSVADSSTATNAA